MRLNLTPQSLGWLPAQEGPKPHDYRWFLVGQRSIDLDPVRAQSDRVPPAPRPGERRAGTISAQIAAEALDPAAGLLKVLGLGGIGDAERRPRSERRALYHRHAFCLEQFRDEILVALEL